MSTRTKDATKDVMMNQKENITLLRQYKALKQRYPEALLLFRVGDFYQAFGDDADILHNVLGLKLTKRDSTEIISSQTGFETAELDAYLALLIKAGHKVALCNQLDDPPTFRGPDGAAALYKAVPALPDHSSAGANTEGVFKYIDPRRIHVSPFQHRTVFDPVEMEELRKDIAKNGVHTALIIRNHPNIEGEFELATGERRLRIACDLTLPQVPVCIRVMTDRQVQELQWSENYRRINPNPLDEAGNLSQMLQYHKTVDGLSRYIGKQKAYVLTRLQLLKLIPSLKEMVHAAVFKFSDSVDMSTLDQDAQQSFFEEYCTDWKSKKNFRLQNLSSAVNKFRCDLTRAIFNPKDKELLPEAGACTRCPFNSATYHSLFPETEKKSFCNRQTCFENKCAAELRRKLAGTIAEYKPTALVSEGPIGKMWQTLLDETPEIATLPRFSYYDIFSLATPSEPDRTDYEYDDDDGGFDEEEYSQAFEEYRNDKEQFEQRLRDGNLHTGLFLQTNAVTRILFDPNRPHSQPTHTVTATAAAVQHAIKAGTATPELLQGEMTRIRDREKRSTELDLEKIQKMVHTQFAQKLTGEEALPETTAQDQIGIRLLLYQALNYSAREDLHQHIPRQEKEQPRLTEWLAQLTDAQVTYMTRLAIRCHNAATNPLSDTGDALRLMAEGIGVDVAGIRAAQEKIAAARSIKANDRLSALQQRIDSLPAKAITANHVAAA